MTDKAYAGFPYGYYAEIGYSQFTFRAGPFCYLQDAINAAGWLPDTGEGGVPCVMHIAPDENDFVCYVVKGEPVWPSDES